MGFVRVLISTSIMLAVALPWAGAIAHHSFSAEFDIGRPVEITGTVTEIEWTNPHAWVHLEVVDDDGEHTQWAVELLGVNSLARSGVTRRTLKPGDVVTVRGFGARDGSLAANASSMTRTETGERLWTSSAEQD